MLCSGLFLAKRQNTRVATLIIQRHLTFAAGLLDRGLVSGEPRRIGPTIMRTGDKVEGGRFPRYLIGLT